VYKPIEPNEPDIDLGALFEFFRWRISVKGEAASTQAGDMIGSFAPRQNCGGSSKHICTQAT
jgi:hypothetical protein